MPSRSRSRSRNSRRKSRCVLSSTSRRCRRRRLSTKRSLSNIKAKCVIGTLTRRCHKRRRSASKHRYTSRSTRKHSRHSKSKSHSRGKCFCKLGVERKPGYLYFIKKQYVYRVKIGKKSRSRSGKAKQHIKVAKIPMKMDTSKCFYVLDKKGDVQCFNRKTRKMSKH